MIDGRPLGVIPSPPDQRDFRYPAYGRVYRAGELPVEYLCQGIERVDDQGAVNSCVAHSLGLIKDWHETFELKRPIAVSRQFIYANRQSYDHQGPGMIPRMALSQLRAFGVPDESFWQGIVEFGSEVWPEDLTHLLIEASEHRIATYVGVAYQFVPELKSAVYTTGPVLYCVPIYQNFAPDANGVVPMPAGVLLGYHAMAIIGWREGAWLVQNSWGSGWGLQGRCWIPWSYPAVEVWAITDATTEREITLHVIQDVPKVWINEQPVEWDRAPRLIDDRFMVPARLYSEAMEDEVVTFGRYTSGEYEGKMYAVFRKKVPVK